MNTCTFHSHKQELTNMEHSPTQITVSLSKKLKISYHTHVVFKLSNTICMDQATQRNERILKSAWFHLVHLSPLPQKKHFSFRIETILDTVMLVRDLPTRSRKRLGCDVLGTFATHAGLICHLPVLLYVHRDHKHYWGRGAQDVHLHFHTAPEL